MQPLPGFPRGHAFVIVPAAEGLATGEVCAASTQPHVPRGRGRSDRAIHTVRRAADVAALMANDLEPAVLGSGPDVAAALERSVTRGAGARS